MSEKAAKRKLKKAEKLFKSKSCPIFQKCKATNCHSYQKGSIATTGTEDYVSYIVIGPVCTCVLITGKIKYYQSPIV